MCQEARDLGSAIRFDSAAGFNSGAGLNSRADLCSGADLDSGTCLGWTLNSDKSSQKDCCSVRNVSSAVTFDGGVWLG